MILATASLILFAWTLFGLALVIDRGLYGDGTVGDDFAMLTLLRSPLCWPLWVVGALTNAVAFAGRSLRRRGLALA